MRTDYLAGLFFWLVMLVIAVFALVLVFAALSAWVAMLVIAFIAVMMVVGARAL